MVTNIFANWHAAKRQTDTSHIKQLWRVVLSLSIAVSESFEYVMNQGPSIKLTYLHETHPFAEELVVIIYPGDLDFSSQHRLS